MTHTMALSFPKSGRTWLEVMTAKAQSLASGLPVETFLAGNLDVPGLRGRGLPVIEFGHGPENRRITADADFPGEIYGGRRVALLVRDPRDVLVSYSHYERYRYKRFGGDPDDFARRRPTGDPAADARWGLQPILNWMNTWARRRDELGAFLLLRYEDIHLDAARALGSLLDFAGIEASPSVIRESVEYGRFENMRRLEQSDTLGWHGLAGADHANGFKTRRGEVGSHRDELTPETVAWIDHELAERLDPLYACYLAPRGAVRA